MKAAHRMNELQRKRLVYQGLCENDHSCYTPGCEYCEIILETIQRIAKRIEKENEK